MTTKAEQLEELKATAAELQQQIEALENLKQWEPWYLNIPLEGIECYVSDVDPNPYFGNPKGLVRQYKQGLTQPFQCGNDGWKYATPINEGART